MHGIVFIDNIMESFETHLIKMQVHIIHKWSRHGGKVSLLEFNELQNNYAGRVSIIIWQKLRLIFPFCHNRMINAFKCDFIDWFWINDCAFSNRWRQGSIPAGKDGENANSECSKPHDVKNRCIIIRCWWL